MIRVAHIRNGIVIKITVKTEFTPADGLVDVTEITCGPGWTYANGVFSPPIQTPEELAQNEFINSIERDKETIKGDNLIKTVVAMSPAEVDDYIQTNVTDLASARQVLKLLARMVLILARREFGG